MTEREVKKAKKMLKEVGRVITGRIIDERGKYRRWGISTDGDGYSQPFGRPKVFSTLDQVVEYVRETEEKIEYIRRIRGEV